MDEEKQETKMYYSLAEVANMLGITRRSMYNYLEAGKIKAIKVGRNWRISAKDVQEILTNGVK